MFYDSAFNKFILYTTNLEGWACYNRWWVNSHINVAVAQNFTFSSPH